MASEKKMDCVILGLLSHESLTGYEIKKRMDTSLNYFWGASFGSIYPTLSSMLDNGLVTKSDDTDSGRNKQIYSITQKGREYLLDWLKRPVEKDIMRYETLMKIFFGNEGGEEITAQHINAFKTKIQRELSKLFCIEKILQDCLNDDSTHKYYLLTVQFGIKTYSAYLEWCDDALKTLSEK